MTDNFGRFRLVEIADKNVYVSLSDGKPFIGPIEWGHTDAKAGDLNIEVIWAPCYRHYYYQEPLPRDRELVIGLLASRWIKGKPSLFKTTEEKCALIAFWSISSKSTEELVAMLENVHKRFPCLELVCIHSPNGTYEEVNRFAARFPESCSVGIEFSMIEDPTRGMSADKFKRIHLPSIFLVNGRGEVVYEDVRLDYVEKTLAEMLDSAQP